VGLLRLLDLQDLWLLLGLLHPLGLLGQWHRQYLRGL
jgi:hypothetical protein